MSEEAPTSVWAIHDIRPCIDNGRICVMTGVRARFDHHCCPIQEWLADKRGRRVLTEQERAQKKQQFNLLALTHILTSYGMVDDTSPYFPDTAARNTDKEATYKPSWVALDAFDGNLGLMNGNTPLDDIWQATFDAVRPKFIQIDACTENATWARRWEFGDMHRALLEAYDLFDDDEGAFKGMKLWAESDLQVASGARKYIYVYREVGDMR